MRRPQHLELYMGDSIRSYLTEIGRIPLLTPEQEVELGQQVQAMIKMLEVQYRLTEELGRSPTRSEWAKALGIKTADFNPAKITDRGMRARAKMVNANLRLVVNIAKKYQKKGLTFQELIQEGSIGLCRAVEKFDPSMGWKFSTYGYWWIRQGITRAIGNNADKIRLPLHLQEKIRKVRRIQGDLAQNLGRMPTVSEIAKAANLKEEAIAQLNDICKLAKVDSLDKLVGKEKDNSLLDMLGNEQGIEEECDRLLMREQIETALSDLNPNEQIVVRMSLLEGKTLAEIGKEINLSRERVRQIQYKAIAKLRRNETLRGLHAVS